MGAIKPFDQLVTEEYGETIDNPPPKEKKKSYKKAKKDDEKIITTSFYENKDFILEQIATLTTHATRQTDTTLFLHFDKVSLKTKEVPDYIDEDITIRPADPELVRRKAIYLSSGIEDYGTTAKLIKDISEYLMFYFEPPKQFEKLLPYYVLFTWVYDKFPFVPYLHFIGLTGTGKTTAAEVLTSVCYKGIDAAGSITIASIFRLADQWRGTLFLDEFDLNNFGSESYKAALSFLKAGVSDKSLFRVEGEKKKKVTTYLVKSPKIFTSEGTITDAGIQSRTMVIKMNKNKRRIPLYRLNDFYAKGQSIRNKLLKWRLDNLTKINLKEVEYGFKELTKVDRRVQQIVTPIYYLSDKKSKEEIIEFVKEQEAETRRYRRESYEGGVFGHIFEQYKEQKVQPTLKFIAEELNKERETMGYKTRISEKKVGETIRKILGFDIKRVGHDYRSTVMVEQDLEKFEELVEYYGMASVSSEASVVSEAKLDEIQSDYIKEADKIFGS